MIVYIACCIICFVSSNKKRSTARLPPPTSSRPAIQLNAISRSQGQFTSTQQQQSSQQEHNSNNPPPSSPQQPPPFVPGYNVGDPQDMTLPSNQRPATDYPYPTMIRLQQIPYPSSGAEAGLRSGEPPRYDELFGNNTSI